MLHPRIAFGLFDRIYMQFFDYVGDDEKVSLVSDCLSNILPWYFDYVRGPGFIPRQNASPETV